jgi:hypothetical protein
MRLRDEEQAKRPSELAAEQEGDVLVRVLILEE